MGRHRWGLPVRGIRWLWLLAFCLQPAAAQNPNSAQVFQPGRSNYIARTGNNIPQPDSIVFQHNLYDGATTPQTGALASSFARTGTIYYADTNTSISSVAADTMAVPAFRYGGDEPSGGLQLMGKAKNYFQWSEDFTNAVWTSVGTGADSADTATAPDGNVTADTISGSSAGDGLSQITGWPAASREFMCSVWLKSSSGTPEVSLQLVDTGSEIGKFTTNLSTDWVRYEVYKEFSAAATGNASCQIIVGATSTVRAWGAQFENWDNSSNTYDRRRRQGANAYMFSNATQGEITSESYIIDNAVFAQVATTGSLCFWKHNNHEPLSIDSGGGHYWFSANGEVFAIIADALNVNLWINSSIVQRTEGRQTFTSNQWQHWCATWDTDSDNYVIYLDGVDVSEVSATASDIVTSTHDLYVGRSNLNSVSMADGLISQILMWDVELSATEVLSTYNDKKANYAPSELGTGKLFSVDLGTSPVPTTAGSNQYWFHREGSGGYWSSSDVYDTVTDGLMPIGFPLGDANQAGLQFHGEITNHILQSEAPATTWAAVGAPSVTDSVGNFFTNIGYGTIDGDDTEGIEQSVAIATASQDFTGSVFASVASGTLDFDIVMQGASGGTPEQLVCNHTATTTVTRFHCFREFTGSATGNVEMQILLNATGVLRVGGMMLEKKDVTPAEESRDKDPNMYVATTTTSAATNYTILAYDHYRNINPEQGTVIVWASLENDGTNFLNTRGPTLFAMRGKGSDASEAFYMHHLIGPSFDLIYDQTPSSLSGSTTVDKDTWAMWAVAWDLDGGANNFEAYKNGVSVDTSTEAARKAITATAFWLGLDGGNGGASWSDLSNSDIWSGVIDRVDIWGRKLTDAEITTEYEALDGDYGL